MRYADTKKAIIMIAVSWCLSGCKPAPKETSFFPDDYRRNYPIVIGEKKAMLDLPVGKKTTTATLVQKETLAGFLERYDRVKASILEISLPSGSVNEKSAYDVGRSLAVIAMQNGVPLEKISFRKYNARAGTSAPIRFSFDKIVAYTRECGKWNEDISSDTNWHHENFGCAYQNNLAAQIANPHDFMAPRKRTTIDGGNRDAVIEEYRKPPDAWSPEIQYEPKG